MSSGRNIIVWLVAILLLSSLMNHFSETAKKANYTDLAFSEFMNEAENKRISEVTIAGANIEGKLTDGRNFYTYAPYDPTMVETLRKNGVKVEAQPEDTSSNTFWGIVISWFPMILLIGVWVYFMRQASSGNNKAMSFGKSRARLIENNKKVTFADVAGCDESKQELEEIIDFLKDPSKFQRLGGRIPKGVLMVGPPGTGKTLLAKAVAGEAKVPFFSISGSDFVEMFVGVGASRVRDLFTTAKKCAPAVVFIDEIDAVGRQRGAGLGGGHDEREQTLNQLLVEMDGFAVNEGIIVIAATNRPDILDPALLRPGRFDRQITVNYPDVKGREAILKVHAKGKPLAREVSLSVLAKRTPGFTGADLENVLNEAAILAARYKKKEIGMTELEEAITRTVVGPEKRSHVITPEDKRITAYHEAGHAVVARVLPNCDPVHEISVIPRGRAAGYTMTMPEDDRDHMSRGKILDEIAMALGGRVAESIFLDDICTGAYSDLQKATELARRMVVEFGMSDEIGPVFLGGQTEVFIAKDWGHQRNFSEEVAARVDKEIRRILEEQYDRAKTVLTEHRDAMERIVKALIEYEHIDGDDFEKLFKGEDVELETFSDRRARIEKADEEVLAKEKAEAEAKAAAEAQEQSEDGEGENK